MKSYNDSKALFSLLLIALVAGFFGAHASFVPNEAHNTSDLSQAAAITATQNVVSKTPVPPEVTLGFVGDIMLDRGVKLRVNKNLGSDYGKLFEHADFLQEPDIMFANLEGPASDKGQDIHNLYSFRMDPSTIDTIKESGIDVVSFANNHIGDWGRPAFEDTLSRLHTAGILACGAGMNKAEAATPSIVEENGFRIGYLCFSDVGPDAMAATDTKSGILLASDPDFSTIIQNAKKQVNILIVSFHWGIEYKTEHNARQQSLAHSAIDNGADMIVGHHPHVAEDMSSYKNIPIVYSLGNFVFDQYFSKETMHGLYVTAQVQGNAISNVTAHTTVFDKNSVVSLEE